MATDWTSQGLRELLTALGVPENCVEFRLIARVGEFVTAEATYYPSLDLDEDGELRTAVKRYRLVELEEDDGNG